VIFRKLTAAHDITGHASINAQSNSSVPNPKS